MMNKNYSNTSDFNLGMKGSFTAKYRLSSHAATGGGEL